MSGLQLTRTDRLVGMTLTGLVLLALLGLGVVAATGMAGAGSTTAAGAALPGVGPMGGGSMTSGRVSCTAPASLPGTRVDVSLMDMGMMGSGTDPAPLGVPMRLRADTTTVPAGQVTIVAQNIGSRTHELVVLPLAEGRTAGTRTPGADGTVDEAGSLGESSNPCAAGSGDGLTAGTTGWVTLTLAPGRYELVCNEANHYADGMWTELDVT